MAYKKIGIDLGVNFIKISRITEKDDKYTLVAAKKYNVEDVENDEEYFKELRICIKDFLRVNKIIFASLYFTLPCDDDNVIVKPFTIPYVEDKLLNKTIEYEIESNTFTSTEEYEYKYIVTNKIEDTEDIDKYYDYNVTVSMIKKDIIKSIMDLGNFNWKIKNIEPQISLGSKIIENNSAIIDFGYKLTRIYLYKDGMPVDIDIVPIGSKDFTDPIRHLSMTSIDGEFMDSELAAFFIGGKHEDLSNKITDITKSFANEFKRSIRGMELNNQVLIEDFLYSGGLSNIEYFIQYISEELSTELKPMDFLEVKKYKDGSPIVKNKNDFIFSALATIDSERELNFLYNRKKEVDYNSILIGVICATIALNIGVFDINRRYTEKIESTESLLREVNIINEELNQEIASINSNMDRNLIIIDRVQNLKDKKKWLSDILYILPGETPHNTSIERASIEAGNAKLSGYSEDYSSVGYLAMALEDYGTVSITKVGESSLGHKIENNIPMKKAFDLDIKYSGRLVQESETVNVQDENLEDNSTEEVENDESEEVDKNEKKNQ